jgi:uncharacterized protein (UPF0335 family)
MTIPLKQTDADKAIADRVLSVAEAQIVAFADRADRIEAERKDAVDAVKELFAEAKALGFDVKALRKAIALRRRDRNDLAEEEAMIELYWGRWGYDRPDRRLRSWPCPPLAYQPAPVMDGRLP